MNKPKLLKGKKSGKFYLITSKNVTVKFNPEEETLARDYYKKERSKYIRAERQNMMADLGLVKVKGNLGGTYWE
jgi:hypothetical protein